MAEPTRDPGSKVTLEQLIQLKRTERPARDFWDDFDRELHRRQLAALVTVEPWIRRATRALATAARRLAPAGAGAAALALTTVAILRTDSPPRVAPADEAVASAEAETKVFLLPEESISVSKSSAPRATVAMEEFRGDVRSAPQELASGLATARRFVAVSAPVTLSNGHDGSAIYSAKALTAGAVLRSLTAAAPESL